METSKQTERKTRIVIRRQPDVETLIDWMNDGGCEATDGCWVESDGKCQHGCSSWLIVLGMI